VRTKIATFLSLLIPGLGHLLAGRRRAGLVFLVPFLLLVVAVLAVFLAEGAVGIAEIVLTPGVLPALAVLNIVLGIWRFASGLDIARRGKFSAATFGVFAVGALLLVVVPHAFAGQYIATVSDFLDSTFATVDPNATQEPEPTDPPDATLPPTTDPTDEPTDGPSDEPSDTPLPSGATPGPTKPPPVAHSSGSGTLPGLGVSVPWTRPGDVPWGDDGRFDLLLLGSDAGTDRWSRRMDVMLLVEIDVATGKVAMIGLPRNLLNAPFPPGKAHNASPCGCFTGMLNAMYVEATAVHPSQWPGSGAAKGIGAVRAVVSQLTGRPVDAVLVADLWGVIKVVDAMGGIDINVPASVYDSHYPDPVYGSMKLNIKVGPQHFDGRMALAYARSRHQDSDYGRMARQQVLLLAIRDQLGPATILKAPALIDAAKGFSWTDLSRGSLPNLIDLFSRAAHSTVKQLRIVPPNYPEFLTPAVITKIQKDIAKMLGTVPPPAPTSAPTAVPTAAPTPTESPAPSPSP
jgi:LCP family protein required for cell wall assembly